MARRTTRDLPDPTTRKPNDPCAPATDLTWLINVAAVRLRIEFDQIARAAGLGDAREWVVLTVLSDGQPRTQLELGRDIDVDKTTLMAILDRMEQRDLVVRTADPHDRRVRIPRATPAGVRIQKEITRRRDEHEAALLADVSAADQATLRQLIAGLAGLAGAGAGAAPAPARPPEVVAAPRVAPR